MRERERRVWHWSCKAARWSWLSGPVVLGGPVGASLGVPLLPTSSPGSGSQASCSGEELVGHGVYLPVVFVRLVANELLMKGKGWLMNE